MNPYDYFVGARGLSDNEPLDQFIRRLLMTITVLHTGDKYSYVLGYLESTGKYEKQLADGSHRPVSYAFKGQGSRDMDKVLNNVVNVIHDNVKPTEIADKLRPILKAEEKAEAAEVAKAAAEVQKSLARFNAVPVEGEGFEPIEGVMSEDEAKQLEIEFDKLQEQTEDKGE